MSPITKGASAPEPALAAGDPGSEARRIAAKAAAKSAKADAPFQYGPPDQWGGDFAHPPQFRFFGIRNGTDKFELPTTLSATWDDVNAILTGSLTVRDVLIAAESLNTLRYGDLVVCQYTTLTGAWQEAWTMRTYKPQSEVASSERLFQLANDLDLARQSQGSFRFVPDDAHPHGWYGKDIVETICSRFKIPFAENGIQIATGTGVKRRNRTIHKVPLSPLEMIRNQLLWEKRYNNRRYVIQWAQQHLWITPLRRNTHLRALGPSILNAMYTEELDPEFASSVIIFGLPEKIQSAKLLQGKKAPTRRFVIRTLPTSVKRYGFVRKIVWSPDAGDLFELWQEAGAYLTALARPNKKLTLTIPGIPGLRRGDAIILALGDQGLWKQVIWVETVTNALSPGSYVQTITFSFEDPYADRREQNILFKLKQNEQAAIGNRAQLNPTWWAPKNYKGDAGVGGTGSADNLFNSFQIPPP